MNTRDVQWLGGHGDSQTDVQTIRHWHYFMHPTFAAKEWTCHLRNTEVLLLFSSFLSMFLLPKYFITKHHTCLVNTNTLNTCLQKKHSIKNLRKKSPTRCKTTLGKLLEQKQLAFDILFASICGKLVWGKSNILAIMKFSDYGSTRHEISQGGV